MTVVSVDSIELRCHIIILLAMLMKLHMNVEIVFANMKEQKPGPKLPRALFFCRIFFLM